MASKTKDGDKTLQSNGDSTEVQDDDQMETELNNKIQSDHRDRMSEHSKEYTKLLQAYLSNFEDSVSQKREFKERFFEVAITTLNISFSFFIIIMLYILYNGLNHVNTNVLPGLITSLVGLISLYITIPTIIAKYLFNPKEDKNMAKIVESIQNYDEKVFANMNFQSLKKNKLEEAVSVLSEMKIQQKNENKNTDELKTND